MQPGKCPPIRLTWHNWHARICLRHALLALYPVVTLTGNFPLIAIELRDAIDAWWPTRGVLGVAGHAAGFSWRRRIFCTLLAITPPFALAFAAIDLGFLIRMVGAFGAVWTGFVFPAMILREARRKCDALLGPFSHRHNPHASPTLLRWGEQGLTACIYVGYGIVVLNFINMFVLGN